MLLIGLLVVMITLGLGGTAQAVGSPTEQRASLGTPGMKVVDKTPLTLRGTGFVAGERVRLVVRVTGREQKRVLATTRGSFVAAFRGTSYNRCSGLTVFAFGSRGSRARLILPAPACPPSR